MDLTLLHRFWLISPEFWENWPYSVCMMVYIEASQRLRDTYVWLPFTAYHLSFLFPKRLIFAGSHRALPYIIIPTPLLSSPPPRRSTTLPIVTVRKAHSPPGLEEQMVYLGLWNALEPKSQMLQYSLIIHRNRKSPMKSNDHPFAEWNIDWSCEKSGQTVNRVGCHFGLVNV